VTYLPIVNLFMFQGMVTYLPIVCLFMFQGMVTYLEHTLDWELNDQASGNIELKNIENIL